MKCKKDYSKFKKILIVISVSILFLSCESSRVGPEYEYPHTDLHDLLHPDLILIGNVKDAFSKAAIPGAVVKIFLTNGTIVCTVLSDKSGRYSFNLSNLTTPTLNIIATKTGYAYRTISARFDKTANYASVSDILLAKLETVTTTVTRDAGGNASIKNTQSVANQPLTVHVPSDAVSTDLLLSISSIPAGQVPLPTTANVAVISAAQIGIPGTQFARPVTINFPLPFSLTPGTPYILWYLTEVPSTYANTGFIATVNADGTTASVQVTHFTTFILQENVSLSLDTLSKSIGPEQFTASLYRYVPETKQLEIVNNVSVSGSGTGIVNEEWLKDIITCRLAFSPDSSLQGLNFVVPSYPEQYIQNGSLIGPAGHESEKGNWEYRWYYALQTTTTRGGVSGPNWSRTITVTSQDWVVIHQGWYWISDVNGEVSGPYCFHNN